MQRVATEAGRGTFPPSPSDSCCRPFSSCSTVAERMSVAVSSPSPEMVPFFFRQVLGVKGGAAKPTTARPCGGFVLSSCLVLHFSSGWMKRLEMLLFSFTDGKTDCPGFCCL